MKPGLFGTVVPSSWSLRSLGELVQEGSDSAIPSETPTLPYIGMEHIETGTGRVIALASPNDYRSSSYVAKPNQVLYGRLRPYLNKVFIPDREVYASREFIPLTPGESLNSHYLLYLLRSSEFVNYAMSLNSGDRPRVKWQQMKSCLIPAPPSDEQDEIVRILEEQFSRLDAAAASIAAVRRKADQFRRSLINSFIFPVSTGRGEVDNSEHERWLPVKMRDISTISYGYTEKATKNDVGPKFLRITDIQDGRVNWQDVPHCVCDTESEAKHLLKTGDLVFARTGATTGKSLLVIDPPRAVCASYLIRLRPKADVVSPRFLEFFFRSDDYWRYVRSQTAGTAQGGVNASKLSDLPIRLPPLANQASIVEQIDNNLVWVNEMTISIETIDIGLRKLRNRLLHDAFTGELTRTWREKNNV